MEMLQINKIRIKEEGSSMDVVIKNLQSEMMSDPCVRMLNITLGYEEGIIILSGEVDTFYHKQLAQEAAKRVLNRIPYLSLVIRNNLEVGYNSRHNSKDG